MTVEHNAFGRASQEWRIQKPRYSLIGEVCNRCGYKIFPPRDICPECGHSDGNPDPLQKFAASRSSQQLPQVPDSEKI